MSAPAPHRPGHVVLVGMMGVGKTTVGRRVAAALDRSFADSDAVIEARAGRTVREIFETDGEAAFRTLEAAVGDDCVLATNTSSLSVASIAAACARPDRVLGVHFFNPAPVMPLVELVPGMTTTQRVVDAVRGLVEGWG